MRAAQGLFWANAAVWLSLGVASIARILAQDPEQVLTAWAVAVLMFGNAAAMGLAAWAIARRGIWTLFTLAVLMVNIVLTFTDQVGLLDWATFAIDLAILGCWMAARWLASSGR